MEHVSLYGRRGPPLRPLSLQNVAESALANLISDAVLDIKNDINNKVWTRPQWCALKRYLHAGLGSRQLAGVYERIFYGDYEIDDCPVSWKGLVRREWLSNADALFMRHDGLPDKNRKHDSDCFSDRQKIVLFWLFLDQQNAAQMRLPPIDGHSAFHTHLLMFLSSQETSLRTLPLMYNFILRTHFFRALEKQKQLRRLVLIGKISDPTLWTNLAQVSQLHSLHLEGPYDHFGDNHLQNFTHFLESQRKSLRFLDATMFYTLPVLSSDLIRVIASLSSLEYLSICDNFFSEPRKLLELSTVKELKLIFGSDIDRQRSILSNLRGNFPNLTTLELQSVTLMRQEDLIQLNTLDRVLTKISCLVNSDLFTAFEVQSQLCNVVELAISMKNIVDKEEQSTLHKDPLLRSDDEQMELSFPRLEYFYLLSPQRSLVMSDIEQVLINAPRLRHFNLSGVEVRSNHSKENKLLKGMKPGSLANLESFWLQLNNEQDQNSGSLSLRILKEIVSRSRILKDVSIVAFCPQDEESHGEILQRFKDLGLNMH